MQERKSRRQWMKEMAAMAAATAALPILGTQFAFAGEGSKESKASVQYQDHPYKQDHCSLCQHFIPGATPKAIGSCQVVAGKVSPEGYCLAFYPKES
ncbi:iron oxidase [Acidithiobacillus sp. CV18-2]|uniref:High-potential iron-sulfur protein n=2 Tax=Igneacidithiobacillus copahuensis TaxID=2724909 RepID=A0AAE2YN79_9PROT|nr:iron oxidase [Acidithiobacillus sp. CV18-3]MBU2757946.1 iron oxidase [Acidithiobacillus sp. BN09-2]MBU2778311.1 iron oxidase [Acidithiobacillus sp. CV18-2]MBU2786833.1 iron oxidase [Igneacidithiobacillus copahuensis]MBU2797147.1 iron oxidase [Acidithiobacillus sp. VAN18-2]MBU2798567.1 iron oxidase [Acidithiobacillus sp. VAN18-4]